MYEYIFTFSYDSSSISQEAERILDIVNEFMSDFGFKERIVARQQFSIHYKNDIELHLTRLNSIGDFLVKELSDRLEKPGLNLKLDSIKNVSSIKN